MQGVIAEEVKAFAWAPDCRIVTFDVRVNNVDIQQTYSCDPMPSLLLIGYLQNHELFPREGTEITVDYIADWGCDFFGFADCMVPRLSVGTSNLDSEGHFEVKLPDITSDPARPRSAIPSSFQLTLREVRTKNPIAVLSPELTSLRAPGGGIKPASDYPDPTLFLGSKRN